MPSPNSTFTEMVTTTLRNHKKELVDNVSDQNALMTWLKAKGHIRTESGGYEIAIPLDYAENSTYQRFSGYDTLNTSASDVLSAAKYDWSQAAIHVTASGRELLMNNGEAAMIKLVKARVKNAMRTAANNMSVDVYSDGALTNQIGGLAAMITQAGTGTVGGIVSGTYTFWKNQFVDMTTPASTNIIGYMNTLWLSLVRGTDKPDLIVSSHDLYNYYESALQANQRYADSKSASAGFESLKYKTASVIFDSNTNFTTTTEDMYFLNTDYLYLIEHAEAKWTQDDEKKPVNQNAVVIPMYWMGQLVTSNRSLQGLAFDT
jgi:hypothetical protein